MTNNLKKLIINGTEYNLEGKTYTAGSGISINGTTISADTSVVQTKGNMVTSLSDADNTHYPSAKAVSDAISASGGGDMMASTYDPNNVGGDAFDYTNFTNTPTASSYDIKDLTDSTSLRTTWSGKQDALSSQTAYSAKGTATKVPQITTNSLGQVTGITEVDITQPTVNDATLTITQNGTSKGTFTANASSNATIALTDTTYESKAASSGGEDVSLVTTGEKYTWNNKQNALTAQTAYSSKGTATKVPTITTNSLGQVTAISETNITFPVTSVNGSTGAVTGLQTTSNLKTNLTDNSDSYYPSQKAVKTAVDGKQDTLVNQTNIKSINGTSLLGSGDIVTPNTTYTASDFDIKDLTDSTSLRNTWSGKQDALVNQTNIKSINGNSLLGSGDLTIAAGVTSVNGNTGAVTVNEVPSSGTTDYVLTKTANGYGWAAPSGGIVNITTGTTSTLSGIWVGSKEEEELLQTHDGTVLYIAF